MEAIIIEGFLEGKEFQHYLVILRFPRWPERFLTAFKECLVRENNIYHVSQATY